MSLVDFIVSSLKAKGPLRPSEISHLYWQQTACHVNQSSLRSTIYRLSKDHVITHLPGARYCVNGHRYSVKGSGEKREQISAEEWVLNVLRERTEVYWDAATLTKRYESEFRHDRQCPGRGYFEDLISLLKKRNIVWDGGRIGVAWNPGDDNPLKVTASDLADLTG